MHSEFCKIKIEYKYITSCGKFCDLEKKVTHHNISQNSTVKNKKIYCNTNSNVAPRQSENKYKKILENCIEATNEEIIVINSKDLQNENYEWEKRRISKDIERGRGGPDVSGFKTMYGGYSSELVEDAKRKLFI
jgi:hypothetical protein